MKNKLRILGLCGWIGILPVSGWTQTEPIAVAQGAVQLVLIKINSYSDFKTIRSFVKNLESVHHLTPKAETPGLLTWEVTYSGVPEALTQKIRDEFGNQYTVTQKTLPSGVTEINVAKGS